MLELIRERVPNLSGASIVLCFPDATLVSALLNEGAQVFIAYPDFAQLNPMLDEVEAAGHPRYLVNLRTSVDEVYDPALVVARPMLFGISWTRLLLV